MRQQNYLIRELELIFPRSEVQLFNQLLTPISYHALQPCQKWVSLLPITTRQKSWERWPLVSKRPGRRVARSTAVHHLRARCLDGGGYRGELKSGGTSVPIRQKTVAAPARHAGQAPRWDVCGCSTLLHPGRTFWKNYHHMTLSKAVKVWVVPTWANTWFSYTTFFRWPPANSKPESQQSDHVNTSSRTAHYFFFKRKYLSFHTIFLFFPLKLYYLCSVFSFRRFLDS